MSASLVEVRLSPPCVVERRELREAAAAVLAGDILVAQCHGVYTSRAKTLNMFQQHRFCNTELGLKTVIIGSSTKLGHRPGEVTGLHRDEQKLDTPQLDVHYVTGPKDTAFEGYVLRASADAQIDTNVQDTTYAAYDFNENGVLLPTDIADVVEEGAYINGEEGTITIWGGQYGFSRPHQFNTSAHAPRYSYVVACHPKQQR